MYWVLLPHKNILFFSDHIIFYFYELSLVRNLCLQVTEVDIGQLKPNTSLLVGYKAGQSLRNEKLGFRKDKDQGKSRDMSRN